MNVITLSAFRESQRATSRTLNDVALLAKARFEMKCMYVCINYLSVLLDDELTFCHHSVGLIVCLADCLSNYLSDLPCLSAMLREEENSD